MAENEKKTAETTEVKAEEKKTEKTEKKPEEVPAAPVLLQDRVPRDLMNRNDHEIKCIYDSLPSGDKKLLSGVYDSFKHGKNLSLSHFLGKQCGQNRDFGLLLLHLVSATGLGVKRNGILALLDLLAHHALFLGRRQLSIHATLGQPGILDSSLQSTESPQRHRILGAHSGLHPLSYLLIHSHNSPIKPRPRAHAQGRNASMTTIICVISPSPPR